MGRAGLAQSDLDDSHIVQSGIDLSFLQDPEIWRSVAGRNRLGVEHQRRWQLDASAGIVAFTSTITIPRCGPKSHHLDKQH